ncbi:tetratricopeptide repeat protein [Candidatus Pelagibacter sp.]|nr:tetratricopeptide repeat protein [Candidatus Pelagibacter sp.]
MHITQDSLNEIKEIINLFKKELFKDALALSKTKKLNNLKLEKIAFFNNLVGLINLSLKDWSEAIKYFKIAILLDVKFEAAYLNLGIAYYDLGELDNSYENFLKALELNKDNKKARDSIIQLLTFSKMSKLKNCTLKIVNNKIQSLPYEIDFAKKIEDEKIINIYKKAKSIVSKNLPYIDYNRDQIFRATNIYLNCERHKRIFNTFDVIPKFCFGCLKIVIHLETVLELIKLSIIFDEYKFLDNFERKCMISYSSKNYRGYIYFLSIDDLNKVFKLIVPIVEKNLGTKIKFEAKRGCTEFAVSHPKYKEIKDNTDKMMPYPKEWSIAEKKIDSKIYKDSKIKKRNKKYSLKGLTLSDFLIINKWLSYAKSINDKSFQNLLIKTNNEENKTIQ